MLVLQRERPWSTGAAAAGDVERHLRALLIALQAPAHLSLHPYVSHRCRRPRRAALQAPVAAAGLVQPTSLPFWRRALQKAYPSLGSKVLWFAPVSYLPCPCIPRRCAQNRSSAAIW